MITDWSYMMDKQKNLNRLDTFMALKDNWDGYGAQQFTKELIDYCKDIVINLDLYHQPLINPTGRDSIQMEYEIGDNYLEFEIYEDKTITMLYIHNNVEVASEVGMQEMINTVACVLPIFKTTEQGKLK
jgi:hypothetical protein